MIQRVRDRERDGEREGERRGERVVHAEREIERETETGRDGEREGERSTDRKTYMKRYSPRTSIQKLVYSCIHDFHKPFNYCKNIPFAVVSERNQDKDARLQKFSHVCSHIEIQSNRIELIFMAICIYMFTNYRSNAVSVFTYFSL